MSETAAPIGLWNIARETPEAIALVDPDGVEHTYGELASRANRVSNGLRRHGFVTGDTLVIATPNCVETVVLQFAALQIGLYLAPVNWHLTGPEIAYILGDSEAKIFVAHERFAETARIAAREAGLAPENLFAVGTVEGFRPLDELIEGVDDSLPSDRTTGAPMLYTSGTTGKPKGVRRPLTGAAPEQAALGGIGFFGVMGLVPHDDHVHICGSPLYHTAVVNFVMISMQLGHKVVLMDKWDPEGMLALIEKHKVTQSHMVPTQFHRLLALPEEVRAKYDVSSLRNMIHGAAPCPREIKQQMLEWWGPVVTEYYAATEGGGTTIFGDEWLTHPGSVGKAWSYSVVKVLDDNGEEVPRGDSGQVYMEMKGSSFEYYKDKEKTQKARVGSMFTTGDIGYMDDEGYLYLLDRKNDMIISGGVNIYPAEIEGELAVHPKVADVAVFGVPHADWGEEIKAVVQPAAGVVGDDALTDELMAYARERLAKFKLPRSIDYIDEMPRADNGKLYKRRLRDPYWEKAERAI